MAFEPKPIETRYRGHRFRSRLEARWAVFFDALALEWEYEKEGYELPSGRYLPDFWLPSLSAWVEIKGKAPTPEEVTFAEELVMATRHPLVLFDGKLPGYDFQTYPPADSHDFEVGHKGVKFLILNHDVSGDFIYDDPGQMFSFCDRCDRLRIGYMGVTDFLGCGCGNACRNPMIFAGADPRILKAITAGRSARFEHGENQ